MKNVPVIWKAESPEHLSGKKVGKVLSFNNETGKMDISIYKKYTDDVLNLLMNECPVSMSSKQK